MPVCAPSLNPGTHMTVCSFRVLFFAFCCHLLQRVVTIRILKVRSVISNVKLLDGLQEILEHEPRCCCSVHLFHPRGRVERLVLVRFHTRRSGRGRLCAPPAHSWKRRKTFSASLCSYESERMSSSFKGLVGGTRLLRSLEWLIPPLVRVFSRPAPLWLFHCLQRRLGNRMQISGQTSRLLFIRSHALTSKFPSAVMNLMVLLGTPMIWP